jgi:hypothetical protein
LPTVISATPLSPTAEVLDPDRPRLIRLPVEPQHRVKFHVESLFRKLSAVTRADAVRKGLRQRLFEI